MSAIWDKQRELYALRDKAARLSFEIRELEQQRARSKVKRLPPHQRLVLQALVQDDWSEEAYCYRFKTIESWTGLTRQQVSRACKALRRLGFLTYRRGLFTEDGEVAGAGYGMTKSGHLWWWEREQPKPVECASVKP